MMVQLSIDNLMLTSRCLVYECDELIIRCLGCSTCHISKYGVAVTSKRTVHVQRIVSAT